jgi:hypothetical protein
MADADSAVLEGQELSLADALRAQRAGNGGQEPPKTDQGQEPDSTGAEKATVTPKLDGAFDAERAMGTIQALRDEVRELRREKMSETDRLRSENEQFKKERDEAVVSALKNEVAIAKKLPQSALDFLTGSNKRELEASADALLKLIGEREGEDPERLPDFGNGARPEDSGEESFSSMLRKAAGR